MTACVPDLGGLNDEALLRYSRHILLDELGIEGQERLLRSRVLVVGAGGLGSPVLLYLASAGVGHITVADDDTVDFSNLQRQIAHSTERVGMSKVESARQAMQAINPTPRIDALTQRLQGAELDEQVRLADAVVDCCDNFATRHAINRACVRWRKPLISGAAIRFDGQMTVFDLRHDDAPCYHCLFPEGEDAEEARCATTGVFAPLVGIVGSVQAAETIKLLAGVGQSLNGQLWLLDARRLDWHRVRVKKDPGCAVCGKA